MEYEFKTTSLLPQKYEFKILLVFYSFQNKHFFWRLYYPRVGVISGLFVLFRSQGSYLFLLALLLVPAKINTIFIWN